MRSSVSSLVEPAFFTHPDYVQTLGPEVGELCALAGYAPDPEQQLILDAAFGLDKRGRLAAFEVAVIACRQNMKTGLLKQMALGNIFLLKRPLVVWSAHEFNTTKEAFRDLCVLIESTPEFERRLKPNGIKRGNGDEAIELDGGQRVVFRARTKSGGRGLSGDDVFLDEAFALQPDHMGALMPLLSTRKNPQLVYGSSAGLASSEVLRGVRDRGRRGSSPRLLYAEWTAERVDGELNVMPPDCQREDCTHDVGLPGCILDDRDRVQQANSQAGRRISWEYIADERQAMPPKEYLRERLGYWDEPANSDDAPAIDSRTWERLANANARKPGRVQVVLHASPDGSRFTIAAAGDGSAGRTLVVTWSHTDARRVVKRLQKMLDRGNVAGVALNPRTQVGALVTLLRKADIEFDEIGALERGQATVGMLRAVEDGTVEHTAQIELDLAVTEARTRRVDEGEVFDQRDPSGPDISPLIAAAGARHRWAIEGDYDIEDSFL